MNYSKSYMFFCLVLFVILYSQVLTAIHVHDESPTNESNLPPMAVQSPYKRILEFKKTISLFNIGKNGCITIKEIGNVMRLLDHISTNVELKVIKNEVDVHIIGYLEWYLEWIPEIFRNFDEDHNDFISVEEFHHFATKFDNHEMTIEAANNTVSGYDIDGDRKLDLNEFINIVKVMIYGHR
ncbi:calmodulin-like [Trifolium pratense]|uniref:calmodulin-like n=1 Tax=Trifolium pratense TaxID=57577 RepID=UPI001E692F1C|nr:calmodulin-like [Trifolium pratense]